MGVTKGNVTVCTPPYGSGYSELTDIFEHTNVSARGRANQHQNVIGKSPAPRG